MTIDINLFAQSLVREFEDLKRFLEQGVTKRMVDAKFRDIFSRVHYLIRMRIKGSRRLNFQLHMLKWTIDSKIIHHKPLLRAIKLVDRIESRIKKIRDEAIIATRNQEAFSRI